MVVHHHLNGVRDVAQYRELYTAFEVGLQQAVLCVMHQVAVHLEVCTLHRDARTFVHHIGAETYTVCDDEFLHLLEVRLIVEFNGIATTFQLHATLADRSQDVGDTRFTLIRQFVSHEVAGTVGRDNCLVLLVLRHDFHLDARSTVVEAHIALHHT